MSKLINGMIPAHTECPFKKECIYTDDTLHKKHNQCNHGGKLHKCDYSCAFARAFDLMKKNEKETVPKKQKYYTIDHSKLLMLLNGQCPHCRDTIKEIKIDGEFSNQTSRVLCLGCKRQGEGFRFRDAYMNFAREHFAEWSE